MLGTEICPRSPLPSFMMTDETSTSAFEEIVCRSKVRGYKPHSSINLGETVNNYFTFAYQREIAVFILKETVNSFFFILFQE